uniref:Uncharacterized protein n=1 Tax=virus sp. ctBM815 TaxID=2825806 RepID=A0A8S5RKJ5_9VIRU|nr:MAG TPA: hypothetical protein [virus sp. ctBM815]DAJ65261.1 MAG TPA: hypothetical protein [Bacteriophage sp.]
MFALIQKLENQTSGRRLQMLHHIGKYLRLQKIL